MQPAITQRCDGKQTLRGVLAGICIACERRTADAVAPQVKPAAQIQCSVWVCVNRIPPAGA